MEEIDIKGVVLGRCAQCGGEVVKVDIKETSLVVCDYCNKTMMILKSEIKR